MQHLNVFESAARNKSFLKVLFTQKNLQIAESNLSVGQGTGFEQWQSDVAVLVLMGEGQVTIGEEIRRLRPGDLFCINAASEFSVENLGREDLKLLIIFGPRALKEGTDDDSKLSEILDPYKPRPVGGL